MGRVGGRVDLHAEADRPALAATRLVPIVGEAADSQALGALGVVAGIRAVLGDLPGAQYADPVRRYDPPPALAVRPPTQVRARVHDPCGGLAKLVFSGNEPHEHVRQRRLVHRQRPWLLPRGSAAVGIGEERLAHFGVARAGVVAVLARHVLRAVQLGQVQFALVDHDVFGTSFSARALTRSIPACIERFHRIFSTGMRISAARKFRASPV